MPTELLLLTNNKHKLCIKKQKAKLCTCRGVAAKPTPSPEILCGGTKKKLK
jgi:hypothetical protein